MQTDIKELNERIQNESAFVDMINMEMHKVIIGQKHMVERLMIGLLAMSLAILFGKTVGALAGYYGGWVDNILMRLADIMLTMPTLFVAILLTQLLRAGVIPFLSAGIAPIVLVIAATSCMGVARLVRASFLSIKQK